MAVSDNELVHFLIDTGLTTRRAIEDAEREAEQSSLSLSRVLVARGVLTDTDARRAEAHLLGIPFVDLARARLDLSVLSLVPEPLAREHGVVAYGRNAGVLEVALIDLATLPVVKYVEDQHHVRIAPRLTSEESLRQALVAYREALRKEYGSTIESEARSIGDTAPILETLGDAGRRALAEDARISRVLGSVLSQALLSGATNIHIEPTAEDVRIRHRLDGRLYDASVLPKHLAPHLALRTKYLSGMDLRSTLPQDGTFSIGTGAQKRVLRVASTPTHYGEKLMLRVVPESAQGFTLESLGLRGAGLDTLERTLHKKEGLILVCGPQGSGKSTFLYTALDVLNVPEKSIHTVEESVEYALQHAHQTQADPKRGLTIARALRAAAAQDADILMVSRIADSESAKVATAAALSGELVLAGVDSGSAVEGILAFLELGVDKRLLASALTASVGVRVVKRLGIEKERYFLNKSELQSLGKLVPLEKLLEKMKSEGVVAHDTTWNTVPFWKPRAGVWTQSEFHGQIGLYEVVPATARLRELVMNGATRTSITEEVRILGHLSLLEDGIIKAVQGLTTIEEVLRAVSH